MGVYILYFDGWEADTCNDLVWHVDECSHVYLDTLVLIKEFILVSFKLLFVSTYEKSCDVVTVW